MDLIDRMDIAMKTEFPKEANHTWYVVDANGMVLGRLASEVAKILRGKHKPNYAPHMDNGDFVVVINAEKITLTGRKVQQKMYYRHSGWLGGIKSINAADQIKRHPDRLIKDAVWGMLPKNTLGRALNKRLRVYGGPDHPHTAQQTVELKLTSAARWQHGTQGGE